MSFARKIVNGSQTFLGVGWHLFLGAPGFLRGICACAMNVLCFLHTSFLVSSLVSAYVYDFHLKFLAFTVCYCAVIICCKYPVWYDNPHGGRWLIHSLAYINKIFFHIMLPFFSLLGKNVTSTFFYLSGEEINCCFLKFSKRYWAWLIINLLRWRHTTLVMMTSDFSILSVTPCIVAFARMF